MRDDVILNKVSIIERCLKRVAAEYRDDADRLENLTVQDSVVLNLQRACEASIDLAMHVVAKRRLGVPQDARGSFDLLAENACIDRELAGRMKSMVGFRNIVVHDYQKVQLPIVVRILDERLGDFGELTSSILGAD